CLQILVKQDCKLQIITKSDLVTRDIDLLSKIPSMVSITITTDDNETAKIIEPHAPAPSKRLKAARTLIENGIPVTIRIDPVIPYLNDNPQSLIEAIATTGVKHVTSSTLKLTPQNWKQIKLAHPELAEKLEPLYFKNGEKTGHYTHLNRQTRFKLLSHVANLAGKHGLKFGTCREGLASLNTATCDGSWLLQKTSSKRI
ncbi:radical SAM protein, partial [Candidatus Bathyarchaeota archaeon]|nr:radical SAM protein [Candidatus Bathyarchaeota archaeon]